jgi:acyl dehydratase
MLLWCLIQNQGNNNTYRRLVLSARRYTSRTDENQYQPQHHPIRGTMMESTRTKSPYLLQVNQYAEMVRSYTFSDVLQYTQLVGDSNPIHRSLPSPTTTTLLTQSTGTKTTPIGAIVPGMLVGSIFSSIIGTIFPGSIYVHQTLDFRHPVPVDTVILGRITIHKLRHISTNTKRGTYMMCHTVVYRNSKNDQEDLSSSSLSSTPFTAKDLLDNYNNTLNATQKQLEGNGTTDIVLETIPSSGAVLIRGEARVWIPQG